MIQPLSTSPRTVGAHGTMLATDGEPFLTPEPEVEPEALPRNYLLASLPAGDLARVRSHLEMVRLQQREVLFEANEPIRYVYFPETAVVSLVSRMEDGGSVEVGTAGCEGMAGLSVFLGEGASSVRAFAQLPGVAGRIDVRAFAHLAGVPGPLHRLMLRYTLVFLSQVAQTAACNCAHLVVERCARWLLMTHDRVRGEEFPLTHEFLAFMLGVRRAGVTMTLRGLQDAGFIDYSRGKIQVIDRSGLEGLSCKCYHVLQDHFARLLPPTS